MKPSSSRLMLVGFLLLGALFVEVGMATAEEPFRWRRLANLPDPVGFAGAFAGVSNDALLVGGGANFPGRLPWEGGPKKWYDSVFVLDAPQGIWRTAGTLPCPLGYGVSVSTPNGLICIGGGDAEQHYRDVFRLEWADGRLKTVPLPSLPRPCAFCSGALLDETVYLAGGIERPDATVAMQNFWCLHLSQLESGWQELEPWPGPERMLAVPAAGAGSFFLISGTRLNPGPAGKPVREYLTDAYRYTPGQGWRRIADVPCSVVAAASPAPVRGESEVLVLGGDDGTMVHFSPPENHPGFSRTILAYSTDRDSWSPVGTLPFSRATVPLVSWRGLNVVCNGEVSPGIRSPEIWAGEPMEPRDRGLLGYGLALGTLLFLLLGGFVFARRSRAPRQRIESAGDGDVAPSRAWFLVGLLWVVAVFNYLDRQVLFSIFPLLRSDLHLADWQLGLLSSVFLWVYGILSPFAGYLADRYGARPVILGSLLVWSAITWLTGQADNFIELLGARALMGVSEACYLPAALALIASVHGSRSRSLATGLHQSGLYVGIVLGGLFGGRLGEQFGWRTAFSVLGLAGVGYMVLLTLLLKPPHASERNPSTTATIQFLPAMRELFTLPLFGTMAFAFGSVAITNWVLYTWLPDYFHQRFHMSLQDAGFSATFYLQAASLVGILLGGWLADRWSTATASGRLWTQSAGLLLAAGALFLAGFAASEALWLGTLILVGFGKGFYDCNIMPVLCQIARPDLRSTGYGVFNLIGCLSGGAAAVAVGVSKEWIGFGPVLQLASLLLFISAVALWRLRLPVETSMDRELQPAATGDRSIPQGITSSPGPGIAH